MAAKESRALASSKKSEAGQNDILHYYYAKRFKAFIFQLGEKLLRQWKAYVCRIKESQIAIHHF